MTPFGGPCPSCNDLRRQIKIAVPADLTAAASIIQEKIAAGKLKQIITSPVDTPFTDVAAGIFDDIIGCHFACTTCGDKFALLCETYHGSGGTFGPA